MCVLSSDFHVLCFHLRVLNFDFMSCVLTFLIWNVFSNFKTFIGVSIKKFQVERVVKAE